MIIHRQTGYSLVELIVVVAFIGILMAIAIPNYINFQMRAKQAECRSHLGAIRTSMFAYFTENNNYNVGNEGTLTYDASDNTGTPFGQSSLAQGRNRVWDNHTLFSIIGYTAEGSVFFNYSLNTNALFGDAAKFTAMASADLDRNGAISHHYVTNAATAVNHGGDAF